MLIPTLPGARVPAWPKDPGAPRAEYVELKDAITRRFSDDRHFAAYSVPGSPRLAGEAPSNLVGGVPLVLAVFDVDAGGHTRTPQWDAAEAPKIAAVLAAHPGGLCYSTRGGYRLVWSLPHPYHVTDDASGEQWKFIYEAWCGHLAQQFGIQADPVCKDWTRLYRLPFVVRDGAATEAEVVGDGAGAWAPAVTIAPPKERAAKPPGAPVEGAVLEGGRNVALARLAGVMRREGADEQTILTALLAANDARCVPPLDESEVEVIAGSVAGYKPALDHVVAEWAASHAPPPPPPARTDAGLWVAPRAGVLEILRRASEPWVKIRVGGTELAEVRRGSVVTLSGGTGSGKSSLMGEILRDFAGAGGRARVLSCELPADELYARLIGQATGSSWSAVLKGVVPQDVMDQALPPGLLVAPRELATLEALDAQLAIDGPGVLVAVDYGQIVKSEGEDRRGRVGAVWVALDYLARKHSAVVITLSQMSRANARAARAGERLGADAVDGGAESAEIERYTTLGLEIGAKDEPEGDGWAPVDLSIFKGRMTGGDKVVPTRYQGVTGKWEIVGEAISPQEHKAQRAAELAASTQEARETTIYTAIGRQEQLGQQPTRTSLRGQGVRHGDDLEKVIASLRSTGKITEQIEIHQGTGQRITTLRTKKDVAPVEKSEIASMLEKFRVR
jgi:hypothetical protein